MTDKHLSKELWTQALRGMAMQMDHRNALLDGTEPRLPEVEEHLASHTAESQKVGCEFCEKEMFYESTTTQNRESTS